MAIPGVGTRSSWRARSRYAPVRGWRPRRCRAGFDARATKSSSESATPIAIPAIMPKNRIPSIAPKKKTKSGRLTTGSGGAG